MFSLILRYVFRLHIYFWLYIEDIYIDVNLEFLLREKKYCFLILLIFLYEEDFLNLFNYYHFNFYLNRTWDAGVYRASIELWITQLLSTIYFLLIVNCKTS